MLIDLYAETNQESDDSCKKYLRGMHLAYDNVHRSYEHVLPQLGSCLHGYGRGRMVNLPGVSGQRTRGSFGTGKIA